MDARDVTGIELTDNILWLLKQAFYFSLTTVNEAISEHGVSTAQIGVLRQLANEPGLSGAELARRLLISPQGVQLVKDGDMTATVWQPAAAEGEAVFQAILDSIAAGDSWDPKTVEIPGIVVTKDNVDKFMADHPAN